MTTQRTSKTKALAVFIATIAIIAPCIMIVNTNEHIEVNYIGAAYGLLLVMASKTRFGRKWTDLYTQADSRLFGSKMVEK